MPAPEATKRLIEEAAARLGGLDALAKQLGISERLLKLYLSGAQPLPDALFLRIVDLISDGSGDKPPDSARA
jgi:hypothetical protein